MNEKLAVQQHKPYFPHRSQPMICSRYCQLQSITPVTGY